MNFRLDHVPARTAKPREEGLTMVMDKGLSLRQAEDLIEGAGHLTDLVKLGFGTSYSTPRLKEKVALYLRANIKVYLGGTLFEAFVARGHPYPGLPGDRTESWTLAGTLVQDDRVFLVRGLARFTNPEDVAATVSGLCGSAP